MRDDDNVIYSDSLDRLHDDLFFLVASDPFMYDRCRGKPSDVKNISIGELMRAYPGNKKNATKRAL